MTAPAISFAHSGDFHIDTAHHGLMNPKTGLNTAVESNLEVIKFIVQDAIKRDLSFINIAGDNFTHGNPAPEMILLLAEALSPAIEAGVDIVIIGGNHDLIRVPTRFRTANMVLKEMLEAKGPGKIHLAERKPDLFRLNCGVQVIALPWMSKSLVMEELDIQAESPAESDRIVAQYMVDTMHRLAAEAEAGAPVILSAHMTVDDVRIDSLADGAKRGSENDLTHIFTEPVVARKKIEEVDRIIYGAVSHIHAQQRLGKVIHYPGSPNRLTRTDAGDPKSYNQVSIDSDGNLLSVKHVATPARVIENIDLTLDDAEDRIAALEEGHLVHYLLEAGDTAIPPLIKKQTIDAGARIIGFTAPERARVKKNAAVLEKGISPSEAIDKFLEKMSLVDKVDKDYMHTLAEKIEAEL